VVVCEREAAHRAASDAELVAWVDEHDQLQGVLERAQLRERGLIGRGTFILLFNSAGELCVHRRTLSKAIYPGDESYAESAARELEEELGVGGVALTAHEHFLFDQRGNRLWCAVFSAVWDGPLRLQPEEVLEARFVPVEQALAESEIMDYCPDSIAALHRVLADRR
jgi:isopentenyldiphosphate isomerase